MSAGEGGDERVMGSRNERIMHIFKLSGNVKITYTFSSEFGLSWCL